MKEEIVYVALRLTPGSQNNTGWQEPSVLGGGWWLVLRLNC